LYVIIVGNAFRFGNVMLLYSQTLAFITMIGICIPKSDIAVEDRPFIAAIHN